MMKLREDLNNLVRKYQRGGLKRLLDEENISDSNSIINYTKLRNIDPVREIKKQTQKIENVQKKNNVSRKKALEIIQKEEFDKNVSRNPQSVGEIAPVEDQSIASKTWEVLTNPVTAASYWLNDQRIPDRFSKGERNNLDIATDLFNPFGIVDSAKNAVKETINLPKNLYNGEYGEAGSNFLNAGINTLSVIPALRELKGTKGLNKELENINPSLAGDLNESFGFLGKNAKRFAKTLPIKLLPGHSDRAEKALELGNNWNRDWYNNPITQDRLTNIINHSNFLERIDWKNMQEAIKDEAYISHFQSNLGKINRFLDGKPHFHNNNVGFSVTRLKESLDPKAPLNKNGTQSFVDKYRPPSEIKLTAIHEGNHNVYSNDSFSGTIFSSMLNKNPQKPLRNIPTDKLTKYDSYLSTPEEIYARIQEIRAENKLAPGELLTDKMVDEIFNKGLSGKSGVDSRFYQLIDKDKFKRVVNVIPAVGAVGIGASTVSEKKLGGYRKSLDNLVEKYQKGGSSESKWEYSVTNNALLPQSQLKNSELGYLKDWLASPMAKKIAVKREGESGLTNLNTRLDRLSDSNLEISTAEDLLKSTNSYTRRRGEKFNNKDLQGTSYTNPSTKYGNIVTRRMAPENVILHEGAHQSTSGNSLLLKNDIEDILSRVRDDSGSYLSNPTEVHARLNVLRKELKDSGVVDPFKTPVSKEHLNKFLNNYKKPGENNGKPLIEANSGELLNILNSQDDAVWLLNNIVDNSNNMNKPFYAQSGGIKPMDKPEQIAWFKEYINSPKYLERLRKEYPNADEETIQRVYEARKANFKDSSDNLSIVKKIDNEADSVLGVQYSRENDYRVDPKYQYKIHDKKAGKIEITEKGLKASPHVVTHEISHGITDGTSKMPTKTIIDIIKRTRGNKPEGFNTEGYARKFSDGFFKNEKEFLDISLSINGDTETYLKKSDAISKANDYFENLDNYSPFSVNEVEKQFNNILYDINGVDGYSKRPTVTDYTSNPTEYLARMQSLRQELKNQGIYDASKEDFTEDHFNKFEKFILDTGPALLRDQYPDLYEFIDATKGSNSFKQPSYKKDVDEEIKKGSDTFKENMIWMMNNVAKNTQKNDNIVYSKKGGEIRNSLNNLGKKYL